MLSGGVYGTITISGGPVDIYNNLTMTAGLLNIQSTSTLNLKSTAAGSASLTQLPSSYPYAGQSGAVLQAVTGSVNVERYISGGAGYRGYRLLTSPVYLVTSGGVNYLSLKYLNTAVGTNAGALTGGPSTYFPGSFTVSNPYPTIYLYDESLISNNTTYTSGKNVGIVGIDQASGATDVKTLSGTTVNAANIPVGNSYLLYYVGPPSAGTSSQSPPPTVITATGNLQPGQRAV